jgi:hypothetical protein
MIVIVEAHYDMQCGGREDALYEALTILRSMKSVYLKLTE